MVSTLSSSNDRSNQNIQSTIKRPFNTKNEDILKKYKSDTATLAKWLDVSVVKKQGKVFETQSKLMDASLAENFPSMQCNELVSGDTVQFPKKIEADVKLVIFSFKHYGFTLLRSWLDPFIEEYNLKANQKKIIANEICFVEYSFLSMAKSMFSHSIRQNIHATQLNHTFIKFGGVLVRLSPLF
jgi:hypothetical protein